MNARFKCPACGFTVFNRRAAKCESCAAELPPEFRFSPGDLSWIEADHARNEKARADLARETAERVGRRPPVDGGGDVFDLLDGLGGDD